MRGGKREIEEERFLASGRTGDIFNSFAGEMLQAVGMIEVICFIAVTVPHPARFVVAPGGSMGTDRTVHLPIFHIDVRGDIERGRQDITVIESVVGRTSVDGTGVIDIAGIRYVPGIAGKNRLRRVVTRPVESQVPFPDTGRMIAALTEQCGDRFASRFDQ